MSQSLLKIVADFTVQLATSVDIGDTTATLSSATDDDSVSLPSGLYGFTIDNGQSNKEYIICTLSGTSITDVKSITRQGVQSTGFTKAHRRGAKVSITDWAILDRMLKNLNGTTGFDSGVNLGYDGTPTGLTGNQFATVNYVLSVVSGGTVTFDKQIIGNQTAGENLTVNDIIYFKESDQRWYKADADLTTTFDQLQIGIAQSTVLTGATVQIAISGPVSGFTGLTAGSKYYLSNTSGAITTTAGTYSVFIGWALSTTSLLFNPVLKTLPTQKEKDAMTGSSGVPSSTNKFVTQDNTTSAGTDQSQTTQNSDIATGEANATTKRNKVAQSFTAGKSKVRGVSLWKTANTGTFTGTVTVSIQADTAGSPSSTALLTKTLTNAEYNALSVGAFNVIFSSEISMTNGSLYWIVIETSTSDSSNHPNIGTNSAGGYTNGSVKSWNTTDGWTTVATVDLYFKTYEGINSQVVITDTSGISQIQSVSSIFNQGVGSPKKTWLQTSVPLVYSGTTGINIWNGPVNVGSDFFFYGSSARLFNAVSSGLAMITANSVFGNHTPTKKYIVDYFASNAAGSGSRFTGFIGVIPNTNTYAATMSSHVARIGFDRDVATDKFYTTTANGSATTQNQVIGITYSNTNNYRIVVDITNSKVEFYINGNIVATHTTNIPSGIFTFAFGQYSGGASGLDYLLTPNFASEI